LKKGVKILLWVLALVVLIAIIGFVSIQRGKSVCTKITIHISDSSGLNLVDEQEIRNLIERPGRKIVDKPVDDINIAQIEKRINRFPSVKHGEIFIHINGELVAEIVPRIPIVRVVNRLNQHYYIDKEGYLMPASLKHPAKLVVANGNISHKPKFDTIFNIYNKKLDDHVDIKTLRDIHTLALYLKSKPFWDAQVQQIYINNDDEIELSTLVGDQIIVLGGIDDLEGKFRNLEIFYKKGLPSKGWGAFNQINLKFKNQVVCTKSN
jgi:cell division protein FtsQ